MSETKLRQVRRTLRYSASTVISMLLQRADKLNFAVMSPASLKTKLSRWENGHEQVGLAEYRRLFRDIYGRTNEELGFPPDNDDDEAEELIAQLTVARTVDARTVELFQQQVEQARHVDRQFGGVTVLDQLRHGIVQIENLLGYSTMRGQREALAAVLTEASALAGWEALDRNAIRQAWDHHERAKTSAREANSPVLLAHATAQQAFILIDLGQLDHAIDQLAEARTIARDGAPSLLRAWLAAAHGEGLAAAGHRDEALRAFDTAGGLLPTDPADPSLPFLFLAGAHLDRWRGHALSKLGEPDAVDQLTDALPRMPPSSPAPEPACWSTSHTPTRQPVTVTQQSNTHDRQSASPHIGAWSIHKIGTTRTLAHSSCCASCKLCKCIPIFFAYLRALFENPDLQTRMPPPARTSRTTEANSPTALISAL